MVVPRSRAPRIRLRDRRTVNGQVERAFMRVNRYQTDSLTPAVHRSTFSATLQSKNRTKVFEDAIAQLIRLAVRRPSDRLADRLAGLTLPADYAVYTFDGTDQRASTHSNKCAPSQGGADNPKGHALLSVYSVRLGVSCDAHDPFRNTHEMELLRRYQALDLLNNVGNSMLRWNRNHHVDMINPNMPFLDLTLLAASQLPKQTS